ncbi:MAG: phosphatase PAP2 family protein [Bacteroidota bacterium]
MNKIIFTLSTILYLQACFPSVNAQSPDSIKRTFLPADSVSQPAKINLNPAPVKKIFRYQSCILPATFIVYGIVSLHTDALQDINETIKEEVSAEGSPHKTTFDNYLQYAPGAVVYLLNAAGIHGRNNFRDRTFIYAMSNLFLGAAVYGGKKITGEERPDGSNNASFPSGHTATAFAAAEFLRQEYKNMSPWYGIAGYAAAAVTGYLRVWKNKHWAGDVIAGAGVGIISTKLAYWIYPVIKRKLFKDKTVTTLVVPAFQNGSFELGMVHHF